MPPPKTLRQRLAFLINGVEPNNTLPTGAPNPLLKQIEIESNTFPYCFGSSFLCTMALNILAPSRCKPKPLDLATF